MINVLIKDNERIYFHGLQSLLKELFHQQINVHSEYTRDAIQQADIIIIDLGPGESSTCIPELMFRRKGIIIGLKDNIQKSKRKLPTCYQDMVFISRKTSVKEIKSVIADKWLAYCLKPRLYDPHSCCRCSHEMLSPQQSLIMALFLKEVSVSDIARELKISDKTVFSHKYLVMQRFNLKNDYELLLFLRGMSKKCIPFNYFRYYYEQICI